MQLDPGLPDRQKSGGQNGQQHIISPDPQHWCTAGLPPQPTPVLPVHTLTVQQHTAPMSSSNLLMTQQVIGLITDNDETAYREEVSTLTKWCQENHLLLNIDKTKELVVDYRRQSREHTPITIDKTPVERVSSFKFLGVHTTEDLTWSAHTYAVLKKAHQHLFFLRRLRKFGTSPRILLLHLHCGEHPDRLYHRLVWKQYRWQPQGSAKGRANCPPHCCPGGELPSLQDIYTRRCTRKAWRIIKDSSHPVPQSALSVALRATFPQHPIPH